MSFISQLKAAFNDELKPTHEFRGSRPLEFLISIRDTSDTPIFVSQPRIDRGKWFATVEEAVAFINERVQMKKDIDAKVMELRGKGISVGVQE